MIVVSLMKKLLDVRVLPELFRKDKLEAVNISLTPSTKCRYKFVKLYDRPDY